MAPKAQVSGAQRFLLDQNTIPLTLLSPTLAYLWYLVTTHNRDVAKPLSACVDYVPERFKVCRRRRPSSSSSSSSVVRRRRPSVPIEFPRKYISFNFMCRVSNNLRTTVAY